MEFQTLFNAAMGGVMMLSGWIIRAVWDAIKSLRNDLRELEREIPSNYVRRDEYREDLRQVIVDFNMRKQTIFTSYGEWRAGDKQEAFTL